MTERPFPSITKVSRESLQISSPLMISAVSVKCTSPHTLPYTAQVPDRMGARPVSGESKTIPQSDTLAWPQRLLPRI